MKLIETIKTSHNLIFIYEENSKTFAFKPSENVEKEILANKLGRIFGIKTLEVEPVEIEGVKGTRMEYRAKSMLLTYYKKKLNKAQLDELKKIILFDIWTGNKDRHTANIFVNSHLIAFDHEKIFNEARAGQCIKLDTGRRLRKDFIDIIEKLVDKKLAAKDALMKIGFKKNDFPIVDRRDVESIVKDKKISEFLCSRADFGRIEF